VIARTFEIAGFLLGHERDHPAAYGGGGRDNGYDGFAPHFESPVN